MNSGTVLAGMIGFTSMIDRRLDNVCDGAQCHWMKIEFQIVVERRIDGKVVVGGNNRVYPSAERGETPRLFQGFRLRRAVFDD